MARLSAFGLIVAVVASAVGVWAQTSTSSSVAGAQLAGRVLSADGRPRPSPVRRAIVQIASDSLSRSRSTITDDQGQFAFDGLPAGRFTVTASRPAFITSSYGATAPGRAGTPVTLAAGQRLTGIDVLLAKGAVIGGVVTDADGEPIPGAQIALVRAARARDTARASSPTGAIATTVVTDDRGSYRIFGIEGGEYYVAAGVRDVNAEVGMLATADMDVALRELQQRTSASRPAVSRIPSYGFAPIYYPSALDLATAASVAVGTSEERLGVDIALRLSPAAAVDGIVSTGDGSVPQVVVNLAPDTVSPLPNSLSPRPSLSVPPGPDGRFQYVGVTPGTYVVTARTPPAMGGGPTQTRTDAPILWAMATVVVSGGDVSGVSLGLRPALHVAGRVAFDASSMTPPANLGAVRLTLPALGVEGGLSIGGGSFVGRIPVEGVSPAADGAFRLSGVLPGRYQLTAALPDSAGWWLRSAVVAGRDLLDVPLEIAADSNDVTGVVVTFSDRHTELAGTLQSATGRPAPEYHVVAFPTIRSLWRAGQRRLRTTRPATDGAFSLRDLPPGDYYVGALTDLDASWQTPEFLDQLVPASFKVTIGEGQTVRQDLRLAR